MKTKTLILFFLLISGITLGNLTHEFDTLRRYVLHSKLKVYHEKVEHLNGLIATSGSKTERKKYAKEIIEASDIIEESIKEIYGYQNLTTPNQIVIGGLADAKSPKAVNPVTVGYIIPMGTITIGSLPTVYYDIDYIKDYAWRIRLAISPKMVERNINNINKRNAKLISERYS